MVLLSSQIWNTRCTSHFLNMKTASVTAEAKRWFVTSDLVSSGRIIKIKLINNILEHCRSSDTESFKCFAVTETDFLFSGSNSKVAKKISVEIEEFLITSYILCVNCLVLDPDNV